MIKARMEMNNGKIILNQEYETEKEMFEYALSQSGTITVSLMDKESYKIILHNKNGIRDFKMNGEGWNNTAANLEKFQQKRQSVIK